MTQHLWRSNKDAYLIKLSIPACLTICSSAAETFPLECIGMLYSKEQTSKFITQIESACPYQKARRSISSVRVLSGSRMASLFRGHKWFLSGEYHSHPFESHEKEEPLEPSNVDLNDWSTGHLEIIVEVRRIRKRIPLKWEEKSDGTIKVNWNSFSFLLKAFILTNKQKRKYHVARLIFG